jgi:CSLREA domain-containing protein
MNRLRPAALPLLLLAAVAPAAATTITVDDAADVSTVGKCTLRDAITAANTNAAVNACAAGQAGPTVDLVHFAIPGSGLHTITLASTLPDITDVVTIDGYSQSGSSANTLAVGDDAVLQIEVSGVNLPFPFGEMLRIKANGTTLRGLLLSHSVYSAVNVGPQAPADNCVIEGNFIGVDASGSAVTASKNLTPVHISGNGNRVGGTTPAARNIIGGGGGGLMWIGGTANLIQGNYIGVSADGSQGLRPPENGAAGTKAIELSPNGPANGTVIGGAGAGAGNALFGTQIGISLGPGTHDTVIKGNTIGTDATGSYALGESVGISTNNAPTGTIIGGALAGEGNVISGNDNGIELRDGAAGTIIRGNRIGTDASGTHPLPNRNDGIYIETTSAASIIGGSEAGQGNVIAYNCGIGIAFLPSNYTGWAMLRNSIHSNRGLGISLTSNGNPTLNDAGDGDVGPNNYQNYPVITSAPIVAGQVDLGGTLNSVAGKTYRLEFFSGIGCHASGHGEGRQFLGALDVITDGNGRASFGSGAAQFPLPAGDDVFTATATDPDGNTSEFSECFGTPDLIFGNGFDGGCSGLD